MAENIRIDNPDDDFEIVEAVLPHRSKPTVEEPPKKPCVDMQLQNLAGTNQMLLTVQPPERPSGELKHTPCDIVLVIDISGSMDAAAELPDQADSAEKEQSGLNILDLVKHASRAIIERLDERDRLAVVTFSTRAKVVQGLVPMTERGKTETWARIQNLRVNCSTNLWAGIREGLNVLELTKTIGNVQGMYILTDGAPNYMCPSQGYVKKLQPILKKMRDKTGSAPTLSTFGFGYHMRSALLRSIAEVGGGNYAFIPDAGMIGTVFVHAVANLFSTFATNAVVNLECSEVQAQIVLPDYLEFDAEEQKGDKRRLRLGNLQYGQSRDIVITLDHAGEEKGSLKAGLWCRAVDQRSRRAIANCNLQSSAVASSKLLKYHLYRHKLCEFLSSLCGKNTNNEYTNLDADVIANKVDALHELVKDIEVYLGKAKVSSNDADLTNITALLADLKSSDPNDPHGSGQISLALTLPTTDADNKAPHRTSRLPSPQSYYTRWGQHYIPSILHAHMRQLCTTFKDPGPMRYGMNSPLFLKCRDEIDEAFDKLPAPEPSLKNQGCGKGGSGRIDPFDMRRYHNVNNPCFHGDCTVLMGFQETTAASAKKKVCELRVGSFVWTPVGARMIREIIKTDVSEQGQEMCYLGSSSSGLCITPWHPVCDEGRWVFPKVVSEAMQRETKILHDASVYSIMLERHKDPNAHIIQVGGVRCATLGHGLVKEDTEEDARGHAFFGDYDLVLANLVGLEWDECKRRICGGILKEPIAVGDEVVSAKYTFVTPEDRALLGDYQAETSLGNAPIKAQF